MTLFVTSCVVPSEKVPVAVNCCSTPSGTAIVAGETVIELRVALVTERLELEAMFPEAAVMVTAPGAMPMARPGAPFRLMLATEESDDVQVTMPVTFCVLPSVNVPVALN